MKRLFLSFILLSFFTNAFSQDMTGTWGGVIQSYTGGNARNQYFFLELKQSGRSIWGSYNITDSNNNTVVRCLCSVTASLPKKPSAWIEMYRERVIDYDKKRQLLGVCEATNSFILHYFTDSDGTAYLTGKASSGVGISPNDPGNLLVAQKMSDSLLRNVDDYFPKLAKLIEKGKTDELKPVIADNIASGTVTEKKLMETLKTMLEKKLPLRTSW
ncbi:MAG: hypothetical protein ABI581_14395 [Sediminibacterium sp.]